MGHHIQDLPTEDGKIPTVDPPQVDNDSFCVFILQKEKTPTFSLAVVFLEQIWISIIKISSYTSSLKSNHVANSHILCFVNTSYPQPTSGWDSDTALMLRA